MKWENLRRSTNVQDRRGQRAPGGLPMGTSRSGSGMSSGLLWSLLFSKGPLKWIILGIMLLTFIFGNGGGLLGGSNQSDIYIPDQSQTSKIELPSSGQLGQAPSQVATDQEYDFLAAVLGSTEDFWAEEFSKQGRTYHAPQLVIYSGGTNTGCGYGSAQAGPFYCPADRTVYIDLDFYRDLETKYKAPGEFAMAYVLAHEVGHHVQNELGIMNQYDNARRRANQREQNQLNVRLELQADYFAGAWTHYVEKEGLLEVGDIEAALQAAYAVGDDTLQKEAYGRVVPDSFTHGTAKQRQAWFNHGYTYGDIAHGDTFNTTLPNE